MPPTATSVKKDQNDEGEVQEIATETLLPRLSPVSDERVTDICECVMDLVAALFNVSGRDLRRPGRCSTSVARVRQIGMYVAHVVLGLNMTEIGRGFGRDRTTVQHACHLIEDMRDDADFDRIVNMTEQVLTAAFRHSTVLR